MSIPDSLHQLMLKDSKNFWRVVNRGRKNETKEIYEWVVNTDLGPAALEKVRKNHEKSTRNKINTKKMNIKSQLLLLDFYHGKGATLEYGACRIEVIEILKNTKSKQYPRRLETFPKLEEFVNYICERDNDAHVGETLYKMIKLEPQIYCPCGKRALFNTYELGYRKFCSLNECGQKGKAHSVIISDHYANLTSDEKKARVDAREKTCLERFGYRNPMQSPDYIEEYERKMMEKYGYASNIERPDVKEKIKQKCLKTLGVENPLQSPEIQQKCRNTFFENHGFEQDMRFARQGAYDKYGCNPSQVSWVVDKIRQTMQDRYGVEHAWYIPGIAEKTRETNMLKFGRENPMHRHISDETYNLLRSKEELEKKLSQYDLRTFTEKFDVSAQITRGFHDRHGLDILPPPRTLSQYEEEIAWFLEQNGIDFKRNDRQICNPYHLDFVLKDVPLAIEFNGVYYHSEKFGRGKEYHLNKYNCCDTENIRLLTIFEDEWLTHYQMFKEQFLLLSGSNAKTVQPGDLKVSLALTDSDINETIDFLEKYSVDGPVSNASAIIQVHHKGELISVIVLVETDGQVYLARFSKNFDAEYVGLLGKVLSFVSETELCDDLTVFADLRLDYIPEYEGAGFVVIKQHEPEYCYAFGPERIPAEEWTRDELIKQFRINPALSEEEIEQKITNRKIWDCGKIEMKWERNK